MQSPRFRAILRATSCHKSKACCLFVGHLHTQEYKKELPYFLTYVSSLVHLALLGISGVLTRYLLEKLFGPQIVGATSDHSYIRLAVSPTNQDLATSDAIKIAHEVNPKGNICLLL